MAEGLKDLELIWGRKRLEMLCKGYFCLRMCINRFEGRNEEGKFLLRIGDKLMKEAVKVNIV